VGDATGVRVAVTVAELVAVAVRVGIGVFVAVGTGVFVAVAELVAVGTAVFVATDVFVALGTAVSVAVGGLVAVGTAVFVARAVLVALATVVFVGAAVFVAVDATVIVAVGVFVAVGTGVFVAGGTDVIVGVAVAVSVAVDVSVAVGALVFVGSGDGVLVATGETVLVAAGVFVGMTDGVGVGGDWKPTTLTGVLRVVVVPSPSWPEPFNPQHSTPRTVMAHVCASMERLPPLETSSAPLKSGPAGVEMTSTGALRLVPIVPSPSCPEVLKPQHLTPELLMRTQLWLPPTVNAVAELSRLTTSSGVNELAPSPLPSAPPAPHPQHFAPPVAISAQL
jgi:hypothetical protein